MLDITQNPFIASALAQAADAPAAPPGGSGTSTMMTFLPIVLIFVVFYVLIILSQQKKVEEQDKMIKALRKGDRVVTTGGIYGKISRMEGDTILYIEIADNVNIKVARGHIASLAAKTEPATEAGKQ